MSALRSSLLIVVLASGCASTAPPQDRNAELHAPPALYTGAAPLPAAAAAEPSGPHAPGPALAPSPAPEPASAAIDSAAQPAASARGAVSFALAVKARTQDGALRVLFDGESLRSGDAFWLELRVFEPLHVYVMWKAPDGEAAVLFPVDRDLTLQPGEARRVPDDPVTYFELDPHPGMERLLIVGSRNPTSPGSDPRLVQLIEGIRTGLDRPAAGPKTPRALSPATKPAAPSPPSPPAAPAPRKTPVYYEESSDYARRGIDVVKKSTGSSFEVAADGEGIFVVPFSIRHLP